MKRKEYRSRLEVLLSVERDRWPDFVDLCDREHKSISLKFSEMLDEELQKNAVGETNPIRIRYGEEQNKLIQGDIRDWLPRNHAIEMAKKIHLNANESKHLKETFEIIERKIKTGYL